MPRGGAQAGDDAHPPRPGHEEGDPRHERDARGRQPRTHVDQQARVHAGRVGGGQGALPRDPRGADGLRRVQGERHEAIAALAGGHGTEAGERARAGRRHRQGGPASLPEEAARRAAGHPRQPPQGARAGAAQARRLPPQEGLAAAQVARPRRPRRGAGAGRAEAGAPQQVGGGAVSPRPGRRASQHGGGQGRQQTQAHEGRCQEAELRRGAVPHGARHGHRRASQGLQPQGRGGEEAEGAAGQRRGRGGRGAGRGGR